MKSIKYGIMLLAAFASFSSCDEHDFLKEKPLDFYSPENSMETSAHFQSSLNYLYNRVRYQVCEMTMDTRFAFYYRRWRCCWCRSASGWRCGWAG